MNEGAPLHDNAHMRDPRAGCIKEDKIAWQCLAKAYRFACLCLFCGVAGKFLLDRFEDVADKAGTVYAGTCGAAELIWGAYPSLGFVEHLAAVAPKRWCGAGAFHRGAYLRVAYGP